jgi:hypothetical protein
MSVGCVATLPARLAAATATAATAVPAATAPAAAVITTANGLRPCLVDDQRPSIKLELVQFVNRFLCVFVRCHLHECEAACPARGLITHHAYVIDGSGAAEEFGQFFIRALIREVAHVQSAAHRCETLSRARSTTTVKVGARATVHRVMRSQLTAFGDSYGSETRTLRA